MIQIIIGLALCFGIPIIYSNYTVYKANKKFYNQLLDKGYSPSESRQLMDFENDRYQRYVATKIYKGQMLRHHLDAVIDQY